ncbi:MAG TPA: hypothetical protein VF668_24060 [Pyrinomonadaceae bacterium]|jgi:hypothetical protein
MQRRVEGSGLRRHRPKRRFRFEYIAGRFGGMTAERRARRASDEAEKEQDGYLELVERFGRWRRGEEDGGDVAHE